MGIDDALGPIETYLCPLCNDGAEHTHGSPEADSIAASFRAEALAAIDNPDEERGWFFISFSRERTAPAPRGRLGRKKRKGAGGRGPKHLGCCFVYSPMVAGSPPYVAHDLGINPGGGARIVGPLTTSEFEQNVPERYRNRLLTSKDATTTRWGW